MASSEPLLSSRDLKVGDLLVHRDGGIAVLKRRKEDGTGWWLDAGGGLADHVIDSRTSWFVVTVNRRRRLFEELADA
jgi:hypothetical protein